MHVHVYRYNIHPRSINKGTRVVYEYRRKKKRQVKRINLGTRDHPPNSSVENIYILHRREATYDTTDPNYIQSTKFVLPSIQSQRTKKKKNMVQHSGYTAVLYRHKKAEGALIRFAWAFQASPPKQRKNARPTEPRRAQFGGGTVWGWGRTC